jgi:hypothetical protein
MGLPGIPCSAITVGPQGLCVTFPGGASVCVQIASPKIPSPLECARALLAEVNAALAPLQPIFTLFEFANAMTAALGPPPDPSKIAAVLAKIAAMMPAASVPVLVGKVLDLLIAYLQGIYAQIQAMILALKAIAAAATKAANLHNAELALTVDCATAGIALQMTSMNAGAAPLNSLIGVVNQLLGLVPGAPTIPSLADLGPDPTAALVPLADAITVLQDLRHAFP